MGMRSKIVGTGMYVPEQVVTNDDLAKRMEIPPEKVFNNIQKYGNCSAASIPMLLAEATRNGKLSPGQLVSMTAFGSGFTWASALIRY